MTLPAVAVVASPRGWESAVVCLAAAAALRAGSAFGVVRALGGPLGPPWGNDSDSDSDSKSTKLRVDVELSQI